MADSERRLEGVPGSGGIVVGPAYVLADVEIPTDGAGGQDEQARALAALQAVAARLGAASDRFRADGRVTEAEILEAIQLMAEDPTLLADVEALAASRPAAAAVLEATERQAALLAAIPDPYLAARAADIRRLGRQAARFASATGATKTGAMEAGAMEAGAMEAGAMDAGAMDAGAMNCAPTGPDPVGAQFIAPAGGAVVLVAHDLGPTDLAEIELEGLAIGGIALAEGSVTSHAAIMARSLGIPLVVGLGEHILSLTDDMTVVLDGVSGMLVTSPADQRLRQARAEIERQAGRRAQLARSRSDAAITADGQRVRLLVNASTERELLAGLAAGAEGIGLLRTELAFLDAPNWPTTAQHQAALLPIFQHLAGRPATVRTLDFGADKTPPFVLGRVERGIVLQLAEAGALETQFRALLQAGSDTDAGSGLRIMLPLVEAAEQVEAARRLLNAAHQSVSAGLPLPPLGAMIETQRAVEQIEALAAVSGFLSIGTNDLVQDLLGLDRLSPAATVRSAADPRVLRAIGTVTAAARRHDRSVEVCGEAAGEPRIAVLLIGLGVSELSVAPSRLDEVRAAVRAVTLTDAARLAETALTLDSADSVLALLDAALAEPLQPPRLSSE